MEYEIRTFHVLRRVWHGVYAESQAVVEHLLHLLGLERVIPPHKVRVEGIVNDLGIEVGLVGSEEETVAEPGAHLALCCGLDNACTSTHLV